MIQEIITYPNPILRQKATPVTEFDHQLETIIKDMADTMFDAPGAGLAAPQIGISKRIIVVNTSKKEDDSDKEYLALINPEIISGEGSDVDTEGCLSVREYSTKVKRFQSVVIKAKTADGQDTEFEASDFFARVLQHEVDHLEGKLFIDRISSLKRNLYKKKLKKLIKEESEKSDE